MSADIEKYYCGYLEEIRLHKDKAHQVEFLTSLKYILETIHPKSKVLDACAGVGAYAFELASHGYDVIAGDIVDSHVCAMKKINDEKKTINHILKTDVLDLSQFEIIVLMLYCVWAHFII